MFVRHSTKRPDSHYCYSEWRHQLTTSRVNILRRVGRTEIDFNNTLLSPGAFVLLLNSHWLNLPGETKIQDGEGVDETSCMALRSWQQYLNNLPVQALSDEVRAGQGSQSVGPRATISRQCAPSSTIANTGADFISSSTSESQHCSISTTRSGRPCRVGRARRPSIKQGPSSRPSRDRQGFAKASRGIFWDREAREIEQACEKDVQQRPKNHKVKITIEEEEHTHITVRSAANQAR